MKTVVKNDELILPKEKFELNKKEIRDISFRVFIVILSASVYALAVAWFLEPAKLVSLGFTGVSQIFNRLLPGLPVGAYTLIFNIPLCLVGLKYVSPRFVFYTMLSVIVQSVLLMGWIPNPVVLDNGQFVWVSASQMTEGMKVFGINPGTETLFIVIFSAVIAGIGIGIGLRYGTSTGGVDVIAQAVNLRKSSFSFGIVSIIFNVIIAIIGGGIQQGDWKITFYTIIFIILCNVVVDKIHTAYSYQRLDIITSKPEEVSQALLTNVIRGCTIAEVCGAYTHQKKYDCIVVVSKYEVDKARRVIMSVDADVWVTVTPVKQIYGKFFKKTII